eukprot:snap_masked-scaffold_3-processed-gene-8.17-mRNA-1 protein AED:0.00 eAED:0.00 QI:115/0.8/0.83/1/0.4/0.33/6/1689/81
MNTQIGRNSHRSRDSKLHRSITPALTKVKQGFRRARLIKTAPKRSNPFEFITVEIPSYKQRDDNPFLKFSRSILEVGKILF